jgi:RNA 2',3'-cyclic 3'-phosphodiesterase
MAKTTRTFVALPVPSALGEKLTRLQSLLAPKVPNARWSSSHPFHMTLAFLGDVPDNELNTVCNAVAEASLPFSCFELRLEGVGAFPNPMRPRVLWSGLTTVDLTPLFDLQKTIAKRVTDAGYRPDDQRFTPHVTLGRIRSHRRDQVALDLTSILQPYVTWSAGTFVAHEVITFASTLTPEGPEYAQLARAPLSGKKTVLSP